MAKDTSSGETVTIKLFSNLPDRKNGQGLVEQTIIDEYMEANASIEVEALDEEAYKTKFKTYAMNGMPDPDTGKAVCGQTHQGHRDASVWLTWHDGFCKEGDYA